MEGLALGRNLPVRKQVGCFWSIPYGAGLSQVSTYRRQPFQGRGIDLAAYAAPLMPVLSGVSLSMGGNLASVSSPGTLTVVVCHRAVRLILAGAFRLIPLIGHFHLDSGPGGGL